MRFERLKWNKRFFYFYWQMWSKRHVLSFSWCTLSRGPSAWPLGCRCQDKMCGICFAVQIAIWIWIVWSWYPGGFLMGMHYRFIPAVSSLHNGSIALALQQPWSTLKMAFWSKRKYCLLWQPGSIVWLWESFPKSQTTICFFRYSVNAVSHVPCNITIWTQTR